MKQSNEDTYNTKELELPNMIVGNYIEEFINKEKKVEKKATNENEKFVILVIKRHVYYKGIGARKYDYK